ncbi:MAG: GNAT family N-acetyltransferase [Bacillota bacterium]
MEAIIRYVTLEDADSFALVYSQSYQAAFRGIIPDGVLDNIFSYSKRREGFIKEASDSSRVNVIMHDGNNPVGILTYGASMDEDLNDSVVEILRIYIIPSMWGHGYGNLLMKWALDKFRQNSYKRVSLWVIEQNERARQFYEQTGFEHDSKTRIIDVGRDIKDLRYIKIL